MGRWFSVAAIGMMLSGCAYLLPGPYDTALNAPPPSPGPAPFPTAGDQRAEAPYLDKNFHATPSQSMAPPQTQPQAAPAGGSEPAY